MNGTKHKTNMNQAARWQPRAEVNGPRRTRRMALKLRPETATRLLALAKLTGASSNHAVEVLIEAEWEKRQHDPKAPAIMDALATLGAV